MHKPCLKEILPDTISTNTCAAGQTLAIRYSRRLLAITLLRKIWRPDLLPLCTRVGRQAARLARWPGL